MSGSEWDLAFVSRVEWLGFAKVVATGVVGEVLFAIMEPKNKMTICYVPLRELNSGRPTGDPWTESYVKAIYEGIGK